MTTMPERPEALRSRLPKPAPDEGVDPVDHRSPIEFTPSSPPAPKRRRKEATVQLAVRVPESVADRVADYALREGITQREVIESLIRAHLPG